MKLTEAQKQNLKDHVYRSQGCSILEKLFLNQFWSWLVTMFPPWLAPNLITFLGFIVAVSAGLSVILQDTNSNGEAPGWALLCCALGIFVYQTLDGCDGKQARRTNTCNSLGELFDHGCDAIITLLYAIAAGCTAGLVVHPYLLLILVYTLTLVCYVYHWQAYVSGILYFKLIDIAEAHYAQIIALLLTFFIGPNVWQHQTLAFLGIPFSLKVMFASGTGFFACINIVSAMCVILTQGVGKNGSTVAGTSVVSPIITPILIMGVTMGYAVLSPGRMLETNSVLFMVAMLTPLCKSAVNMMLAGMVRSPFPLVDPIMIGPMVALANVYCGAMLPEFYLLLCIMLYNLYDVLLLCVSLCREFSETLNVSCFTIPSEKDKTH